MEDTKERILAECRKNLERGRAVATGIGLFVAMVNEEKKVLLRRRLEKDSLLGLTFPVNGKWSAGEWKFPTSRKKNQFLRISASSIKRQYGTA